MDSPNAQNPDIVVRSKKKDPSLEGGNSMNIDDMWTLKHDIISQKYYELLIKT